MVKKREVWKRNYSELAKQRMENNQCPACGKPKSEWTRTTSYMCCSKDCSDKFYKEENAIQDWSAIRARAFRRDNYTCKHCGRRFVIECNDDVVIGDTAHLVGDHIIPIAVGGKEFDINNVQTLCVECNKIKTRRDARIIAKHRRREKELKLDIDIMEVKFPLQKTL
jgi:5-methylcytosine-specific restriction endonuclease McrA